MYFNKKTIFSLLKIVFFYEKIFRYYGRIVIDLLEGENIVKLGKLSNEVLKEIVINNIDNKRKEVLMGSNIGEDTAIIDFGEEVCVLSTDPITGASKGLGKLAVNISCNDVATSGGEPLAILITILAPEDTKKEEIEEIMKESSEACKDLNIEIAGGHTEITNAVNRIVVSTTVIGKQSKEKIPKKSEIEPGYKVLLSKNIGIEGTSILAKEREDYLKTYLGKEEIEYAKNMDGKLSVVKEGKIAGDIGVNYMHDITEGGVFGAIWEMANAIDLGIRIFEDRIPVDGVTKKIGEIFDIDIYKFISSGSMLMISSEENSKKIIDKCSENKIDISIIGEVTGEKDIVMVGKDKLVDIVSPDTDELYKALEF